MRCLHLSLGGHGHVSGCTGCRPCNQCTERVPVELWNNHQREHAGLPVQKPLSEEFLERCHADIGKLDFDSNPLVQEAKAMGKILPGEREIRMTE